MKQSIKLERPELANLFSSHGFTLYLRDGQDITLLADRADLAENGSTVSSPSNGKPPTAPHADTPLPPARGRSRGSRAERSAAMKKIFFQALKETGSVAKAAKRAGVHFATGYLWRKAAEGQGRRGRKSPTGKKKYPCGDCPQRFDTKQGLGGHRRIHRSAPTRRPRALNPPSRDFNQARELTFWCRPCNIGFPSQSSLEKHQQKKHGLIIRTPAPPETAA